MWLTKPEKRSIVFDPKSLSSFINYKTIKKGWKILLVVLSLLAIFITGSYFALQNSKVQTFLAQKFAIQISKQLKSEISIGKVEILFFNKISLENVLIKDLNSDTLIYAELIAAKIDTLKLRKQRISVKDFRFENSKIDIKRDSLANFNFNHFLKLKNSKTDSAKTWKINCNQFGFRNSIISYNDFSQIKNKKLFVNDLNINISAFQRTLS